jgi:hypothetical protein
MAGVYAGQVPVTVTAITSGLFGSNIGIRRWLARSPAQPSLDDFP